MSLLDTAINAVESLAGAADTISNIVSPRKDDDSYDKIERDNDKGRSPKDQIYNENTYESTRF
jgi:hypothetical protein